MREGERDREIQRERESAHLSGPVCHCPGSPSFLKSDCRWGGLWILHPGVGIRGRARRERGERMIGQVWESEKKRDK
jgi:hypothetical protein